MPDTFFFFLFCTFTFSRKSSGKRTLSCSEYAGPLLGLLHFLYVVELFPVEIRNVGVGMSFNIGFCIFGGFAPMISEALHDLAFWAPGVFQSLAGIVTATTVVLSFRFQSRGVLCLAHVRDEPYFDSKAPCWATVKARDTKEEELPAKEVSLDKFQVML